MKVELKKYAWSEYCELDTKTGEREYYDDKKISGFTGLYFSSDIFFAAYPTKNGPIVFYEGKEYELHDGLDISLTINGENRRFEIADYGIAIEYEECMADEFYDENEADLFYKIYTEYKDKKFYDRWTKD